jgi:monovalent cation:H+ antiporter-2, CPA2 family
LPNGNKAMEIKLLNDIVIIFAVAVVVLLLCHKLRLPTIIGFLFTGALTGPHGFGLIAGIHEVEILAEVGIVLLLFTIGIEFSIEELLRIKRQVLVGGALQVGLTIGATYVLVSQLGLESGPAIFAGFLVCLSSTAIVMRLYQESAVIDTSHGRLSLAILIFQDIAIVPLMLFAPILAGTGGDPLPQLLELGLKAIGVIIFVFVASKWIVPHIFFYIALAGSRELFLISTTVLCFAVAWLTAEIGLSLALGAFLAGLIISESEYGHQALDHILPFRDVFTSFFFVSVGMLLDVHILLEEPLLVFGGTLVVLLLQSAGYCPRGAGAGLSAAHGRHYGVGVGAGGRIRLCAFSRRSRHRAFGPGKLRNFLGDIRADHGRDALSDSHGVVGGSLDQQAAAATRAQAGVLLLGNSVWRGVWRGGRRACAII